MRITHKPLGSSASFSTSYTTSWLPTSYGEIPSDFIDFGASEGVILPNNQTRTVKSPMHYKKKEFNQQLATAGKWQQHPDPLCAEYRLEVRIENNKWYARITNPDLSKRRSRPYIVKSLGLPPEALDKALVAAKAFCTGISEPIARGPTLNDVLDEYIAAGCPCKIGKGNTLGARQAKAQAVCDALLRRTAKLIGDTPLASDLWGDVVQGLTDKLGGPHNFLKVTGFLRAVLHWAKTVKRLKIGDLPCRGATPDAVRAAFETEADIERLLRFARQRGEEWLALHMQFLRYSGIRPGDEIEIAAIRFRDVATVANDKGWVEVRINKPKPGTPRRIAVADAALLGIMGSIRALHPTPLDPDALVFPPREYGRDFKTMLRALQAAEPDYAWVTDSDGNNRTLYSFRHFHASERGADAGRWNEINLSKHLGNTPDVCRKHYLKWNPARIAAAMPAAG